MGGYYHHPSICHRTHVLQHKPPNGPIRDPTNHGTRGLQDIKFKVNLKFAAFEYCLVLAESNPNITGFSKSEPILPTGFRTTTKALILQTLETRMAPMSKGGIDCPAHSLRKTKQILRENLHCVIPQCSQNNRLYLQIENARHEIIRPALGQC